MLPPISSPWIVTIDEGSPLWKPDDIMKDPLIPPPPEFTIAEYIENVIFDLKKQIQDKGKKFVSEPYSLERTSMMFERWSQAQINLAFIESIQIQSLKDNYCWAYPHFFFVKG